MQNTKEKISDLKKLSNQEVAKKYQVTKKTVIQWKTKYGIKKQNQKKTTEQFKKEVFDLTHGEYKVLGEYINNNTKIKIKHITCGHIWEQKPRNFIEGKRCPVCRYIRKTDKEFKKQVDELTNKEIIFLSKFKTVNKKGLFYHKQCGHVFVRKISHFIENPTCPNCNKGYSQEQYIDMFNKRTKNEYILLSKYKGMDKKIKVKHNPCGHEFKIRARFIQEKYLPCAACKTNSNEKLIAEFLKDKNIDFKTQYTFNELRGKKKQFLRFDFAVFKNNKIKFLLEYDGIQHFKAIDFFGGQEALEENKTRDKKKNYFCKTNNIKLIRIPYFEKDLTNFLNKLIRVEGLI